MLMFDETADANENQMAMMEAAENVETAQVTFAARDSEIEGVPIKQGEIMGLCNGKSNTPAMILKTLPINRPLKCLRKIKAA